MNKYQESLAKLLTAFNGHWPPRAELKNWPPEIVPYMEIADEIPQKLYSTDCKEFRAWMKNALCQVNMYLVSYNTIS